MDTDEIYAKPKTVSDAEIIRAVFPRHTAKLLARAMNAPIATARSWLYRSLSSTRRRELALALIAQIDREDAERALVRACLEEIVGGTHK